MNFDQVDDKECLNNQVQIDQTWISSTSQSNHMIDPNILMCMVCYGIPLGQFAQCNQCGRIFCEKDYQSVKNALDTCPNCQNKPFIKKYKPHILYASLFQRITFQCRLCDTKLQKRSLIKGKNVNQEKIKNENQQKNQQKNENQQKNKNQEKIVQNHKKYNKHELFTHINDYHRTKIMDLNVLYDFQIHLDKGKQKIPLDFYQNIQLNQKFIQFSNKKKVIKKQSLYQLDNGNYLVINLQTQIVTSRMTQKTGKLFKRISKDLKKDIQYQVWSTMLDHDQKYYSQKMQQLIQKQYKQFKSNKKKNEFIFDLKDQRYRISFAKMKQINTYSQYQRPIRKNIVKFQ